MKQKYLLSWLLTSSFLCGSYLPSQSSPAPGWQTIGHEIDLNISGMALFHSSRDLSSFLIVHDNKKAAEPRLGFIQFNPAHQPTYSPIPWPENREIPDDLEAISVVPGLPESTFMALTSAGKIYHLQQEANQQSFSILKVFEVPQVDENTNLEGFALQNINGVLMAVWAHRGADQEPGKLYWGILDLATYQIHQQGSVDLSVPWPLENVRHISDLKIDPAGVVFISAASDPGNNGPFQSAIYVAGAFSVQQNRLEFQPNLSLVPLYRFDAHKVEAIELIPGANGGMIFGTDDENFGSSVYATW